MYTSAAKIIPALIPQSLPDLQNQLSAIAFCDYLQIDVVDGNFAPFTSWPYHEGDNIRLAKELLQGKNFEVDLMVNDQLGVINTWADLGASTLIFHLEGLSEPVAAIKQCREREIKVGFSVGNDIPLEQLYTFIPEIDFVQLMGIASLGVQGQPFDSRVLERIAMLRALYPDLTISVDGSVNPSSIKELHKAGADRFAVGSYILQADNPEDKFTELVALVY